ncbi:MAG: hypothetical protein VX589_02565 [Myxococcota bacterium]|nr:hypothetical protein [Myxococcota bacterium]
MSTNNAKTLALLGLSAVVSCGEPSPAPPTTLVVHYASSSDTQCVEVDRAMVRQTTGRFVVQRREEDGAWQTVGRVEGPLQAPKTLQLESMEAEELDLRIIGCTAGQTSRSAYYRGSPSPSHRRRIPVHLRPVGTFSCGAGDRRFESEPEPTSQVSRAFAVTAKSSDALTIVVGGATTAQSDGTILRSQSERDAWSQFDPVKVTFSTNDRDTNDAQRTMLGARIGAVAAPIRSDRRQGTLIIGGAEAIRRTVTQGSDGLGPFEIGYLKDDQFLSGCRPEQPRAEFYDVLADEMQPVANENQFGQRSFAGSDTDAQTTVIAGGLECGQGGVTASRLVEVVIDGNIQRLDLGTPLLGATVTAIGAGRFVVWGFPTGGCEQTPGWLVTTIGQPTVAPITISGAPNRCQNQSVSPSGCAPWVPTAYHSATRLSDGPAGEIRILILGGLSGASNRLTNTPKLGNACRGNAFILTVRQTTAQVEPMQMRPGSVPIERVYHRATPLDGDRVLVTGGWVLATPSMTPCSGPADCFGSLCFEGFCRDSMPNPGAFFPSNRWFIVDGGQAEIVESGWLATPRFGHQVIKTDDGDVIIMGGISSAIAEQIQQPLSATMETYVPAANDGACGQIE